MVMHIFDSFLQKKNAFYNRVVSQFQEKKSVA